MDRFKTSGKSVFILGIGSDIGKSLAMSYLREGYAVMGTYRRKESVKELIPQRGIRLLKCNVADRASVKACIEKCRHLSIPWDIFISCVGSMEPIGRFFECNFDRWERSVIVNSTAQLRILRGIYPLRRKGNVCDVVFFAGGGTNNPFTNYSAYCVSKIMLIKMCELLSDENKDLNVFIVGPGPVKTKIHNETLKSRARAGDNYIRTARYLRSDDPGTDYKDIYDCINWCIDQGISVAGGRNFSVVHDSWRRGGRSLARMLRNDPDKFKLRRFKNKETEGMACVLKS